MTLPVRGALAAAAATATLLALAGCGDGSDNEKASDSAASSENARPAPADGDKLTGDQFADVLQTAIDEATTAHMTIELGGAGSGEGDADYTTSPPELAMKLSMGGDGDMEVRLVGGSIYVQSAAFGDKWVSLPLDDPDSPLGPLAEQLDVNKQFETFAAAVTEATYAGAEDVDGESLDHYTATVDTEKLLAQMPSSEAQTQLPETLTQEWWFDDQGLIRKFSSDIAGTSTEITMTDWGSDVEIEAPPSAEVTSMPGTDGETS